MNTEILEGFKEQYLSDQGLIDREGNFYPCEFGDHERLAPHLIYNSKLYEEYQKWSDTHDKETCLDFLINVKNWAIRTNSECAGTVFECNKSNELMDFKNADIELYFTCLYA